MNRIDGKVVWLTGASSGIGKALALHLSAKNCKLILSARNTNNLEQVRLSCSNPDKIVVLPLDLEQVATFPIMAEKALSFFGKIDVLINNAGISQRSLILETELSVYKKLMDINYLGTIALSKALLPYFVQQGFGQFAVITSLMGKFASPYRSGYCGAKHALHGFFDALRMEHEKDGIQVCLVCPGFVATEIAKNAVVGDGSKQGKNDDATANGMPPNSFATQMVRALEKQKFEVYIGGKETKGIFLKRFFPKLLHRIVLKSAVR
ncbi:SDR family oxidoreductase [Flavobacterium sp. ASW18X]|uniref:SDR family oxidoreductase n=1 Tax=Flavobacterium sp. ASW18X TaxID=2572595 RepID=UPI0010AEDF30|nr:SDR family oxidoreductase [Flavobacterium sp. ASW18X]TKD66217.1 SDR family oxidoreductase [Flavobacterium sp. ASW18X]